MPSNTAIGQPFPKQCEDHKCGKVFMTYEPKRQYCCLAHKDRAARYRRRQKDIQAREGLEGTGQQEDSIRAVDALEQTRKALAALTPEQDLQNQALAFVRMSRAGTLTQEVMDRTPQKIKDMARRIELEQLPDTTSGESYIVQNELESVLRDVGLTGHISDGSTEAPDTPADNITPLKKEPDAEDL